MASKYVCWVAAAALIALAGCGEKKPEAPTADAAKAQAESASAAQAKAAAEAAALAKQDEALKAGVEAVIYGLPLVIMDITRAKITNVAKAGTFAAPVNQFANMRAFPDASFKDVVRANVDTLYSSAFLDLSAEPMVLTVPDTQGRYYLMPMLDAWTNIFASPGKRTTGTKAGTFAVTGPGWTGELPKGLTELKSPTQMVWIIGRTQTNGPKDYAAVHKIQDGYKLTPLSAYGKPFTPPEAQVDPNVDMKTPPVEQLQKMSSEAFFTRMAALLKNNPPPGSEAPVLDKLKAIGIVPGEKFDPSKLDPDVAKGLEKIGDGGDGEAAGGVEGNRRADQRLARAADGRRQLRQRLRRARGGRADRPGRQPAGRRGVPVGLRRCRQSAAARCSQVRDPLRQGRRAAGECLLVDHHVHGRFLLRAEPDQPLLG